MKLTNMNQLIADFKAKNLKRMHAELVTAVEGEPYAEEILSTFRPEVLEDEWRERYDHGGEYNVRELVMEDVVTSIFGEPEQRAVITEGMIFQFSTTAILHAVNDLTSGRIPKQAEYTLANCLRCLTQSFGQFLVLRMCQKHDAPEGLEHSWIVAYGDFLNAGELETEEEYAEAAEKLREGDCRIETDIVVKILPWTLMKKYIGSGHIRPLGSVEMD